MSSKKWPGKAQKRFLHWKPAHFHNKLQRRTLSLPSLNSHRPYVSLDYDLSYGRHDTKEHREKGLHNAHPRKGTARMKWAMVMKRLKRETWEEGREKGGDTEGRRAQEYAFTSTRPRLGQHQGLVPAFLVLKIEHIAKITGHSEPLFPAEANQS